MRIVLRLAQSLFGSVPKQYLIRFEFMTADDQNLLHSSVWHKQKKPLARKFPKKQTGNVQYLKHVDQFDFPLNFAQNYF